MVCTDLRNSHLVKLRLFFGRLFLRAGLENTILRNVREFGANALFSEGTRESEVDWATVAKPELMVPA